MSVFYDGTSDNCDDISFSYLFCIFLAMKCLFLIISILYNVCFLFCSFYICIKLTYIK